jgi:TetR/AcrR family transcriptional regulator
MESMTSGAPHKPGRKLTHKSTLVRQQEIVDAAVGLIGSYGVRGTTVSRIAAVVGISRGALYRHFPNREAVLQAALVAMANRSSAWVHQATGPDVLMGLCEMGEAHSAWALSEFNTFVRPFFQLIASNRPGPMTAWIVQRQGQEFRYLAELVEEGKRRGSIRPDAEPGDIAWTLLLHAWGEDIARLMGVEQFITDGASNRILRRALDSYAARPSDSDTDDPMSTVG